MTLSALAAALGFVALTAAPAALALLALGLLLAPRVEEQAVHKLVGGALSLALAATLGAGALLPLLDGPVVVDLGTMIALRGFHLDLAFVIDGAAWVLLALDFALCGLVGLFSARYLHQDEGFARFYVLLLLLALGVSVIASAAGLDLLFAGWELVGLSSALLIAFFHRREQPAAHGLRAYAVYRTTDLGLLLGLMLAHHLAGASGWEALGGLAGQAGGLMVGALLVFGAMGKGASLPFTGWLPRAMEGPTPSSAIFYGALSIHASPFLLLRAQPLILGSTGLTVAVAAVGLLTAAHASMVGRVQSDVKATLGYASVAQVGLMWVEVALGLHDLVLVHLLGHASLRTWQLLRAPNLLHDRRHLAELLGHEPWRGRHVESWMPAGLRRRLHAFALARWGVDEAVERLVHAITLPLRLLDRADARWIALVEGPFKPPPQRSESP